MCHQSQTCRGLSFYNHICIFDLYFRFSINLKDKSKKKILLHINVRFNENQIVVNTHNGKNWEKEKRNQNMYVKSGQLFTCLVSILRDRYRVSKPALLVQSIYCAANSRLHVYILTFLIHDVMYFNIIYRVCTQIFKKIHVHLNFYVYHITL